MSANSSAQAYLDVLLDIEGRADLVSLFHRNTGLIDTEEGIGRRIGLTRNAVQSDLAELVGLGLIIKKKFGKNESVFPQHVKRCRNSGFHRETPPEHKAANMRDYIPVNVRIIRS